jgi:hypothetical protein
MPRLIFTTSDRDAALEGLREDIAKRYMDRRVDNYSARQIATAEAQRRETRTITLSACEVNDFALDDAELAALVRRRWQEATT